jgi:predicted RNase H-like HicB family nuclease
MLTQFIEKAMKHAEYRLLEEGSYSGRISECSGVIAFGATLYVCQSQLRETLEGWLIVKIRHGDRLPIIDGLDLNKGIPPVKETAACG